MATLWLAGGRDFLEVVWHIILCLSGNRSATTISFLGDISKLGADLERLD